MNHYPWHSHYVAAMLEPIPNQVLISLAENAINARLHETLRGEPISPNELKAVKYSLHHLRLLKREVER